MNKIFLFLLKNIGIISHNNDDSQKFSHQSHRLSAAGAVQTRVQAVVVDPEVVFVASLMEADAPALLASFQCDVTLQIEDDSRQNMRAMLRDLKVQACPFIRNKDDKNITTVRSNNVFTSVICQ